MASARRKKNTIHTLKDYGGIWKTWDDGLDVVVVEYFQTLFASNGCLGDEVLNCIDVFITPIQLEMLAQPYDAEEIKATIFSMYPDKALGPDVLNPAFFQRFCIICSRRSLLQGMLNLNINAAINSAQGKVGFGWILRNHAGGVLAVRVVPLSGTVVPPASVDKHVQSSDVGPPDASKTIEENNSHEHIIEVNGTSCDDKASSKSSNADKSLSTESEQSTALSDEAKELPSPSRLDPNISVADVMSSSVEDEHPAEENY
ncbi:hypothetical protein GH714_008691 [Hevea brasiliensis]|uniref:Uncharacterized protein n=1 Tax=Hevea brasiliensis TaxID=3981 RepID=A0A6A6NBG8_HEVBR|nr:hypothetical protein GH714_008691 [Hevea brasiliensis]